MSNKVIRLDTLKKNVYDINKYDPDYMFNLKAFVNYAIKLYNSKGDSNARNKKDNKNL